MRGSTISEMLVVLILTGIIFLSVFDGLGIFAKVLRRGESSVANTINDMQAYYNMDYLFSSADSIVGNDGLITFYKRGEAGYRMSFTDSLLIISREGHPPDTVFRNIHGAAMSGNRDNPGRIDSVVFYRDTVMLRFGLRPGPEISVREKTEQIERTGHEGR